MASVLAAHNARAAHSEKMNVLVEEVKQRTLKASTENLFEIRSKLSRSFRDFTNVHFFQKNDEIAVVIITPNKNKKVFKVSVQVQTEVSSTTDRVNQIVKTNAPFFLNETFAGSPILTRVSYIVASSNDNPSKSIFTNETDLSKNLRKKIIEALAEK